MNQHEIIRLARKCGFWVDNNGIINGGDNAAGLLDFAALVASAEREACAKVCENMEAEDEIEDVLLTICAELIRARGKT